MEIKDLVPTNARGLTVSETLLQRKLTKDEANYIEPSPDVSLTCGTCRFYLRDENSGIGRCQAVEGDIAWFGTSDLYISAEDEAEVSFMGDNAYAGEDDRMKSKQSSSKLEKFEQAVTGALVGQAKNKQENSNQEKFGHLEDEEKGSHVPFGVTSFEELRAVEEAQEMVETASMVPAMTRNAIDQVMFDDTVESKPAALVDKINLIASGFTQEMQNQRNKEKWQPLTDKASNIVANLTKQELKIEGGVKYKASDFAYTPDKEKVSTWKLRMAEGSSGNITVSQLGRAAAAFSSGGFRGNKVQIPSGDVSKVKGRIRSEYKKLGVKLEDMPKSVKAINQFQLLKQDDGTYRWLAIYSNKFRDEDNPPEIISEDSHKKFDEILDKGLFPYPELWLGHVPGTRWGQADFHAYDDRGFVIASGTVDKGREIIAENIAKETNLLVSHGMPKIFIKRSQGDPSIITQHITTEISPLPEPWIAANKLTGFEILDSEDDMALDKAKKDKLTELGFDAEAIESVIASKATEAEGLEFKEDDNEGQEGEQEAQTESGDELRNEVKELASNIAESMNQMAQLLKATNDRMAKLEQSDEAKIKQAVEDTPAASLGSIYNSAIGQDETKVDGREKLAKSKPKETQPVVEGGVGIRFIDNFAAEDAQRQ